MNRAYSRAGIITRLFNQPLAVTAETAAVVLGAIGPRLDVSQLFVPTEGRTFSLNDLEMLAADERVKLEARGATDRRAKGARAEQLMFVHNGVAHIPIRGETVAENGIGPISGFTGYDGVAAQVQSADGDPNVRGLLMDINSPGGEVDGLYECVRILMARRGVKPMRALIRGLGCSAAYAIAACADDITLHDLGFAGSVGTIALHADHSGALEQDGIKVTMFIAGAHKADGNPFEPLPEDVGRDIQSMVDIANSRFVNHVAAARGLKVDDVIAQQARIYRGSDAIKAGLVDKVMSWQDSMDEFEQQVNDPAARQGKTAPTGARSAMKGNAMSSEANAPAASEQPDVAAITTEAHAAGRAEGHAAGVTAERERIVALAEIGGVSLSESVSAAISEGTDPGAFAVAQARAGKEKLNLAAAAAKNEAVQGNELPESGARAANPAAQADANRGKAYMARKQAARAG